MKRLLIAAALFAASAVTATAQTTWNLPTAYADSQLVTKMTRWFADEVGKRTNGELKINVHSNSSLYRMPEILHAVRSGQVQAGDINLGGYSNENPVFALESVPFLAAGVEETRRLRDAQWPVLQKIFDEQGMELLFASPFPGQGFFTKNEMKNYSDLKGAKVRVGAPILTKLVQELGAEPVMIEFPDVPQAFMTGMVQAMITGSPAISTKPWEFLGFFYPTDAYFQKEVIFVNKAAMAQLPEAVQQTIRTVAAETEQRAWAAMIEDDAQNKKVMEESGMKVVQASPELMKELHAAGDRVLDDWRKSAGEEANAVIDAFLAGKKD